MKFRNKLKKRYAITHTHISLYIYKYIYIYICVRMIHLELSKHHIRKINLTYIFFG